MDFHQLEIFVQLAHLKSFSRTAERLYISQPTVSTRVKALEQEVGAPLLDRYYPGGISLTEAGREFMDYAQEMLNLRDRAFHRLNREEEKVPGHLHLGASTVPGCYLLPGVLSGYCAKFPQVNLAVTIRDTSQVLSGIQEYFFDVGMVGSKDVGMVGSKEAGETFSFIKFAHDELVLIAPPGTLASEGYPSNSFVPLSACRDKAWLVREPGSATRKVLENALQKKGEDLKSFPKTIFMDSLEGIKHSVRFGLGVSVVSRHSVEDYLQMGYLDSYYIQDLQLRRSFYVVFHRNRVLSTAAASFLDFLQYKHDGS